MEFPPNRISELRKAGGLSRVEVAVKCEVGEVTVRRWETGETTVPDKQKFLLADLLGTDPAHLMGWDRQPPNGQKAAA